MINVYDPEAKAHRSMVPSIHRISVGDFFFMDGEVNVKICFSPLVR